MNRGTRGVKIFWGERFLTLTLVPRQVPGLQSSSPLPPEELQPRGEELLLLVSVSEYKICFLSSGVLGIEKVIMIVPEDDTGAER